MKKREEVGRGGKRVKTKLLNSCRVQNEKFGFYPLPTSSLKIAYCHSSFLHPIQITNNFTENVLVERLERLERFSKTLPRPSLSWGCFKESFQSFQSFHSS